MALQEVTIFFQASHVLKTETWCLREASHLLLPAKTVLLYKLSCLEQTRACARFLTRHAGDRDDVVKLWDLRKATLPTSHINPAVEAACLGSSPSQTIGKRQHGVTCLTLSPEGMPIWQLVHAHSNSAAQIQQEMCRDSPHPHA